MRIPLSEHRTVKIYRRTTDENNSVYHFEEGHYSSLEFQERKQFKKNVFPYSFTHNHMEDCYELKADYYIGLEWLIEGKKYVYVEPKVNTKLLEIYKVSFPIEEIAEQIEKIDFETKKEIEDVENNSPKVDYLKMLLDIYSSRIDCNEIGDLVNIDWEAKPINIKQKDDLLTPFLIVQFLKILQSIVKKGLKRSYYKVEENLNNKVRGRIFVANHIKQNIFKNRLTKTYCEYQIYGDNNLENKFLKKVFLFTINYIQNNIFFSDDHLNQLKHIINYCRPAFEHVDNDIKDTELKNIKSNPFFKEYKEAIKIGGYILKQFAYNISSTQAQNIETPPFWIDMPRLFELYVYQKLLEGNMLDISKILFQFGTHGNYLDFLIKDKENPMIIDAKYKLRYRQGHIHQDIRQVSGYSRLKKIREKLNISRENDQHINCLIIYPSLEKKDIDFNIGNIVKKFEIDDNQIKAYHKVFKIGILMPTI